MGIASIHAMGISSMYHHKNDNNTNEASHESKPYRQKNNNNTSEASRDSKPCQPGKSQAFTETIEGNSAHML